MCWGYAAKKWAVVTYARTCTHTYTEIGGGREGSETHLSAEPAVVPPHFQGEFCTALGACLALLVRHPLHSDTHTHTYTHVHTCTHMPCTHTHTHIQPQMVSHASRTMHRKNNDGNALGHGAGCRKRPNKHSLQQRRAKKQRAGHVAGHLSL